MSKVIITLYVIATSSALVVLKLGAKTGPPISFADGRMHININPLSIAGVVLYGFSFLIYVYLISKYELGFIIPLTTALVYVLVFTCSYFIFREVFTPLKIIGILLIVSGLIILNVKH